MSLTTAEAPPAFSIRELEDKSNYVLNGHFRCDRCGAQAYVEATLLNDSKLLFCGHHAREHLPTISPYLKDWYTEESRIKDENKAIGSANS